MRAARRALLFGLCTAASGSAVAGDLQSLVQKGLGVHAPEDAAVNLLLSNAATSLEEPPHNVIRRITSEVEAELPTILKPFMTSLVTFLEATVSTMYMFTAADPPLQASKWTPEEFAEQCAGILVAFRDPNFASHLNQSMASLSAAIEDFGYDMSEIGEEVDLKTRSAKDVDEAKYWLEHTAFTGNEALARGTGNFHERFTLFLQGLPTTFLQQTSKGMKAKSEVITVRKTIKSFRQQVEPLIKSFFEEQDLRKICHQQNWHISIFSKASEAVREEGIKAIAGMRAALPTLEPYIRVGSPKEADQVLTSINDILDSFKKSILKMGIGMHIYSEATAEAMREKLKCTAED